MGTKILLTLQIFQMYIPQKETKRGWFPLRGTQEPICCSDREPWELWCLLGPKVWDVVKRVPQLVKSTDFYALLPFHVGINDTANQNLDKIKENYKALVVQPKYWYPSYLFFHFASKRKGCSQRQTYICIYYISIIYAYIMQTNFWLSGWCCLEGFGFYNNRTFFDYYSLSGRNGILLSGGGKGIFEGGMSTLMMYVLNGRT